MSYAYGETVHRDRRNLVDDPYNPARQTTPDWPTADADPANLLDTIDLDGVYVAASSESALADPVRAQVLIGMSLYSTDRDIDVKIGDRIRDESGLAYSVQVRPRGDINPFTGWAPGVEIPLSGVSG